MRKCFVEVGLAQDTFGQFKKYTNHRLGKIKREVLQRQGVESEDEGEEAEGEEEENEEEEEEGEEEEED